MSNSVNLNLRRFQDELTDIVNKYDFLPIEARLLAVELIAKELHDSSNQTILNEIKEEEEQCKKPMSE